MLNVASTVSTEYIVTKPVKLDPTPHMPATAGHSQHMTSPIGQKEPRRPRSFPQTFPEMATANGSAPPPASAPVTYTFFRNVSACNRCRVRKNRCDQRLPRCHSCEKAKVHCVGYDATTKREVPRSYLYFLESRVAYLEQTLADHGIQIRPSTAYEGEDRVVSPSSKSASDTVIPISYDSQLLHEDKPPSLSAPPLKRKREDAHPHEQSTQVDGNNKTIRPSSEDLVPDIGMASVHGAPDPKHVGSTSGISFANVVFAAVRSSVPPQTDNKSNKESEKVEPPSAGIGTMRDSFFSLQAKLGVKQAALPDRELGDYLAELYFEHENPQLPILHRVDFVDTLDRVYSSDEASLSPKDLYTVFIVLAIGSGVNFGTQNDSRSSDDESSPLKRRTLQSVPAQPEEYHASAIVYLEKLLHASSSGDALNGNLDELQAILLLAGFAVLRPVPPGLWYIVGAAMRLAIDLGLHYEDGTGIDSVGGTDMLVRRERMMRNGSLNNRESLKIDTKERGRREWIRDLRRRLFWCCYALDRLVSTCVNRPFAIPDSVITTEFPSLLDDKYITREGIIPAPKGAPSYKLSALHYVRLRLLQSEIQQVLHHQQAKVARQMGHKTGDDYIHSSLPCPFLVQHSSFHSWRASIMRRLDEWKESAPAPEAIGVRFPVEFLELNYWQTVIMLYRQSLTVPEALAQELNSSGDMPSPSVTSIDHEEDEEEMYCKVAEAGRKVLRIYRQLHRVRLVNYTYLATHTLFTAGVTFLYAIWHSPTVRSRLTLEEVDLTILAATSVLGDLIQKCPPAEACRDAFNRMSETTVRMCLGNSGFGSQRGVCGEALGTRSQIRENSNGRVSVTPNNGTQIPSALESEASSFNTPLLPKETRCSTNSLDAVPVTFPGNGSFTAVQSQQFSSTLPQSYPSIQQNVMQIRQQLPAYTMAPPFAGTAHHHRHRSLHNGYPTPTGYDDQAVDQSRPRGQVYCVPSPTSRSEVTYDNNGTYSDVSDRICTGMLPYTTTAGPAPGAFNYGMAHAAPMPNNAYAFNSFVDASGAPYLDLGLGIPGDYGHDWSEGVGLDMLDGYFFWRQLVVNERAKGQARENLLELIVFRF
ncbi:Fungal specific transcription factor [Ascosphaera pollenicola]|nr:Fungal specific transcription factor [Ascosphaera pollenicola]